VLSALQKCNGIEEDYVWVLTREIPLTGYVEAHPEYAGHLCHRIYDLRKLKNAG